MAADFSSPSMMLRCSRAIGSLKPSAISDVSSGASSCSSARASACRFARWMFRESTSGTATTTSDTRRALRSTAGSSASRASDGAALGVVEPRQRTALRERERVGLEQHAGRHQRTGEGAPPRLVGARHEPGAERPIVPEQLAQRRRGRATGGDGHGGERTGGVGAAGRAECHITGRRSGWAATAWR